MPQTEFYAHNLGVGWSKGYETSCNTILTGTSDYLRALMEGNAPPLPELQTRESSNMIGSANEFETGVSVVSDYYDVVRFQLGEFLNAEQGGALWHQGCGGGITDTAMSGGNAAAIDHGFGFALDSDANGFNMLTRSFIFDVGGIKYIFGGCGVDEFGVNWDGGTYPKFTGALIGTGYHKPLSSYPLIVVPTLEAQIPFNYLSSVGAQLSWTGAPWGGLYDAAASGRFMGLQSNFKNNARVGGKERQPNDPVIIDADGYEGAVQGRLRRGDREGTMRITLRLDNQEREFKAQKSKAICTGLKLVFPGAKIPGTTTARFEFELKIPKFRIIKVTPDEMDKEEVLHLDLKLYKDTVTGGLFTGRIRNAVATGIIATS